MINKIKINKKILSIIGIIGLILANMYFFNYVYSKSDNIANVYINNRKRIVEKAITQEQQMSGLMKRPKMDKNKGMIFIWNDDVIRNFWMKDTMIPLDIIYIDSGSKIIKILNSIPYDLTPLSSDRPARFVLEINGGQSKKYNIKIGDKVKIK